MTEVQKKTFIEFKKISDDISLSLEYGLKVGMSYIALLHYIGGLAYGLHYRTNEEIKKLEKP